MNVPPQVVQLPNHRLAFNMQGRCGEVFANLVTPGDGVLGVTYRCSPTALGLLDEFEAGYDRVSVQVFPGQAIPYFAIAYVAKPERIYNYGRATADYLRRIVVGARQHGLPEDYIRRIKAWAAG